jgi:hypothetical protein
VAWTWRYEAEDGTAIERSEVPVGEQFPTQGDAETWIGEVWRDLLATGVAQVTLLEDDHRVYGPMSLHPAT